MTFIRTLRSDVSSVMSSAFAPDSHHCAFGTDAGEVFVVGSESSDTTITVLPCCSIPVMSVSYLSPEILVSGDCSGAVRFWDVKTCQAKNTIQEPDNEIFSVTIQKRQKHLASCGKDATLRYYDAATSKLIRSIDCKTSSQDKDHLYAALFHPKDENICVTGGWNAHVLFWDVRVPSVVRTIQGPKICGEGLDIDENELLTASWIVDSSQALQLFDLRYVDNYRSLEVPDPDKHGAYLYCGKFDSKTVLAGGSGTRAFDIFDRKTGSVLQHDASLPLIESSESEELSATATPKKLSKHPVVQTVAYAPNSELLAVAGSTRAVMFTKRPGV
eukprot:m.38375 g.38375  ORF g.38375 m.38375 type:complete len:330 (-) comp16472_c0_seq3:167-1156(-)